MRATPRALARAAVVATALVATATLAPAAPASAAPPVAQDDHASLYAGEGRAIDVLTNDSDPDGDDLAVCRVPDAGDHDDYYVGIEDDALVVYLSDQRTEDLAITYYACDYETLVPATLTISVKPVAPLTVRKLDRPGRLRVTNDNDARARFLWGSFKEKRPDGHVGIAPHDSVVVRVHRHRIDWVGVLKRTVLAGQGHVRGIELPRHDRRAPARAQVEEGWPPGIGASAS